MNKNVLYHNSRCSKSRQTLEILKSQEVEVVIKEYLKEAIDINELKYICNYLSVSPVDIIRIKDKKFHELGLSCEDTRSNADWFKIIQSHPELLQRPILIYQGKVAIGRPPENILTII